MGTLPGNFLFFYVAFDAIAGGILQGRDLYIRDLKEEERFCANG